MRANTSDRVAVMMMNNYYKVHTSEWAWLNETVDMVIDNDADIASLHSKVRSLFTETGREHDRSA